MPQHLHLAVDWLLEFPQTPADDFQHDSRLEYGDSQHIFQCFRGVRSRKTQWVWAGSFIASLYRLKSDAKGFAYIYIYCYYCGGPTGKAPNSWLFIVHSHPFLVISFGDGAYGTGFAMDAEVIVNLIVLNILIAPWRGISEVTPSLGIPGSWNGGTVPYKAIFWGYTPLHRPYIW